ncbi:MAG: tRNA lysidine(34) synthetase TilS [Colwellia sp.]|nr:tRNA lysidine(34) synthetase TilS [Colwellia sp.]
MSLIQTTLSQFFNRFPKRPIVVAYSGGIDSQVLLHALSQLKLKNLLSNELSVCHINHGLSRNSRTWQQAAEKFCQQLSLPIQVFEVNVKEVAGESLEALAREARYKALKAYAANNALIVTGHHLDDQSETFLLALKRGAGLKGLSAMAETVKLHFSSPLASTTEPSEQLLVRPLLNVPRKEIDSYALAHKLTWVEDESNEDLRFDRNFIRHQIMPLLTNRWPAMLTTIKRSSEHCQEGQLLLTELAQQDLANCQLSPSSLSVYELTQLSSARFNNLIRYFLEINQCLMPSTKQLQQIQWQLLAASDKSPEIKVSSYWLRRFKGALIITPDYQNLLTWQHQFSIGSLKNSKKIIKLPDGLGQLCFELDINDGNNQQSCNDEFGIVQYLKAPESAQQITIRFSHDNPKCLPDFRQHSRELKKVLQELNIAPWQRKRIPFIYYNNVLVSAVGYFICKEYLAEKRDVAVVLSCKKVSSSINN